MAFFGKARLLLFASFIVVCFLLSRLPLLSTQVSDVPASADSAQISSVASIIEVAAREEDGEAKQTELPTEVEDVAAQQVVEDAAVQQLPSSPSSPPVVTEAVPDTKLSAPSEDAPVRVEDAAADEASRLGSSRAQALHAKVLAKEAAVTDGEAHRRSCQQALSKESREDDPFGIPLWRRVIREHKRSPSGDCRSGQRSSGCSAFTAQGLQDLWLYTAVWRHLNRTGVFVDLAANHYYYISNTFFADHCLQFDGICIEANPQYHSALKKKRRCVLEPICIAEKEKNVEFDFSGVFGGIVGEKKKSKVSQGHKKKMTCQPLSAIFRKYDVSHVDYMNLDVEGVELQCLEGIDWNQVAIDIIGIEVNPHFQQLDDFLVSKNYIRTVTVGHDAMYVHKSAGDVLHIVSEWQRNECARLNEALKGDYRGKNVVPRCSS